MIIVTSQKNKNTRFLKNGFKDVLTNDVFSNVKRTFWDFVMLLSPPTIKLSLL